MPVPLTAELGRFVAGLRYEEIPKEALPVIHTGFTDCIGVMIAGAVEPAPQILRSMLKPGGDEATLLFSESRASALDAAWINGTAAHALDYDDVAYRGHPSCVLVPAILAESESLGASGRDMMVAYAAGYETWAELVRRDPDQHHLKGWHPTGIFGAIATAAACASLHKLNAEQAAVAIAVGASQSAGLASNFGSMTKPFHAGRSAHAGITAARLAKLDFTASLDALEHPPGFLTAVSPAGRVDLESPTEAGIKWKLTVGGLSVKKYPMCFCTHRALDGMLDLVQRRTIDPNAVHDVCVVTSPKCASILRNHNPETGLAAKFSMEFAMASALIVQRAGPAELTDAFVRRSDVQSLMKRVKVISEGVQQDAAGYAPFDQVTIQMSDGKRVQSAQVTKIRGGPDLPLSTDELWEKFEGCLKAGTARVPGRRLFDALMALERLPNARQLPGLAAAA